MTEYRLMIVGKDHSKDTDNRSVYPHSQVSIDMQSKFSSLYIMRHSTHICCWITSAPHSRKSLASTLEVSYWVHNGINNTPHRSPKWLSTWRTLIHVTIEWLDEIGREWQSYINSSQMWEYCPFIRTNDDPIYSIDTKCDLSEALSQLHLELGERKGVPLRFWWFVENNVQSRIYCRRLEAGFNIPSLYDFRNKSTISYWFANKDKINHMLDDNLNRLHIALFGCECKIPSGITATIL
jgi:hypothetical protein